jgi:nucleotide-binding universal stress UspA family protein
MFRKILHANDGSDSAFRALEFALMLARQNDAELHMVSVEEISLFPETIGEVRSEQSLVERRFRDVLKRARVMAEEHKVGLKTHLMTGHPVRCVVDLAAELGVDLLVIGATGHSALYERLIGSRADRIIQLAPCPALVIK